MPPDQTRPAPNLTPEAEAARLARLDREAAALRENLRRRKAQSRARAGDPAPAETPPETPRDPTRHG